MSVIPKIPRASGGLCPPGPAGDLKRPPDPSHTHAPPNHKSWIRRWILPGRFVGELQSLASCVWTHVFHRPICSYMWTFNIIKSALIQYGETREISWNTHPIGRVIMGILNPKWFSLNLSIFLVKKTCVNWSWSECEVNSNEEQDTMISY
jgi:hypothetical protein